VQHLRGTWKNASTCLCSPPTIASLALRADFRQPSLGGPKLIITLARPSRSARPSQPPHQPPDPRPRQRHQQGEPHRVGQDPGRHQQRRSNQDDHAVEERHRRQPPFGELRLHPPQHRDPLIAGERRPHHPGEQDERQRRQRPDPAPDLDQQRQLDGRDQGEQQQQAKHEVDGNA